MSAGGAAARLALSALVAAGAALGTAIVVAAADLWLTGHGYPSITRELFAWRSAGVALSVGDLVLLLVSAAAGCATWFLLRRARGGGRVERIPGAPR